MAVFVPINVMEVRAEVVVHYLLDTSPQKKIPTSRQQILSAQLIRKQLLQSRTKTDYYVCYNFSYVSIFKLDVLFYGVTEIIF